MSKPDEPRTHIVSVKRVITDGKPISGRFWKSKQKRTSNRKSAKDRKSLWEQKVEAKKRFKQMKELEKQVINNRNEMLTKRKEKTLAKKKRKAEAELENSRYQFITNDKKIKKMSKKQLRLVKKLRMNPKRGVVEIVGAYDK